MSRVERYEDFRCKDVGVSRNHEPHDWLGYEPSFRVPNLHRWYRCDGLAKDNQRSMEVEER